MLKKLIALFRGSKPIKESPFIQERLMKILYNPFVEKPSGQNGAYWWVVFNPKTRIWEWQREALPFEVDYWKGEVIGEWKGEK